MIRTSSRVSATSSFTKMANDGITGMSAAGHEIIPARRGGRFGVMLDISKIETVPFGSAAGGYSVVDLNRAQHVHARLEALKCIVFG